MNHFYSNLSTINPHAFHSRELKHGTVQGNVYLKISVVLVCTGRSNIAYKLNSCCSAAEMPCQNCQVADKSGGESAIMQMCLLLHNMQSNTPPPPTPPLPFCVGAPSRCQLLQGKFKLSFHRTCPHTRRIKNLI